jgi:hypothetical protein
LSIFVQQSSVYLTQGYGATPGDVASTIGRQWRGKIMRRLLKANELGLEPGCTTHWRMKQSVPWMTLTTCYSGTQSNHIFIKTLGKIYSALTFRSAA